MYLSPVATHALLLRVKCNHLGDVHCDHTHAEPFIYSLRYEDIHRALKRLLAVASIKVPPVVVLKKFPSFQSVKNLNWNLIFWLK